MWKFILGAIVGVIVGGALIFFFFGGVPRAAAVPGEPVRPPDAGGMPPGTAEIVIREDFFNQVLATVFRDMNPPAFPVGLARNEAGEGGASFASFQAGQACDGLLKILPEGSGVKTGVRFDDGKLSAPLAFSGSYNSAFGCLQFTGWAQADLELRFDAAQQTVFGRINVETVNLDGVSPLISGLVTPVVQTTINNRVNPIQMIQGKQIALNMPIAATQGNLRADVKDVRAEVKDQALHLYAVYEFSGDRMQSQ
jgi:hypothetical protein